VIALDGGRVCELRAEPLDVVRWTSCEVDLAPAADGHEAVELARAQLAQHAAQAGGRLLAARLRLHGRSRAHVQLARAPEYWLEQMRACALDVSEGAVWVERVELRTRGLLDAAELASSDDALGQLARSLHALGQDPTAAPGLDGALSELRRKLPREALEGEDALRLDDEAALAALLADARELIMARLLAGDDA
jgi:hypothetical protein